MRGGCILNYPEIAGFAREVALGASGILREGFRKRVGLKVGYKSERDPVTEIDLKSEEYIRESIRSRFPSHGIMAEEGGGGRAEDLWIVDPLDGTVNFMRGHPYYAVSIAYVHGGEPCAAAVAVPETGEVFTASKGGGAHRNGCPIAVSGTGNLGKALLATGFAYNRSLKLQNNLDNFSRLTMECTGVRRCGAAVIDLAFVAAGILDAFWELYLAPWDVAAGVLLVTEAGGKVTDFAGGPDCIFGSNILASNGALHEQIRSRLTPFRDEDIAKG